MAIEDLVFRLRVRGDQFRAELQRIGNDIKQLRFEIPIGVRTKDAGAGNARKAAQEAVQGAQASFKILDATVSETFGRLGSISTSSFNKLKSSASSAVTTVRDGFENRIIRGVSTVNIAVAGLSGRLARTIPGFAGIAAVGRRAFTGLSTSITINSLLIARLTARLTRLVLVSAPLKILSRTFLRLGQSVRFFSNRLGRAARAFGRFVNLIARSTALLTGGGFIFGGLTFLPVAAVRALQSAFETLAESEDQARRVLTLFSNELSALRGAERVRAINTRFREFQDLILQTAQTTGLATGEISEGLFDILSAGVGVQNVGERLEALQTASNVAVGGVTSVRDAFRGLIAIVRPFQVSFERAGDVLFAIQRLGIAPIQQLAPQLGRASAAAAAAGVSLEQFSAAISTTTAAGIPLSSAVTGLRQILAEFAKGGSGPARKALDELAASFPSLNLQVNAAFIRQRGLLGLVKELQKVDRGRIGQVFRRVRALIPLLALIQNQARFERDLGQITKSRGEAEAAAQARQQGLLFTFRRLRNAIEFVTVAIGEQVSRFVNAQGVIDRITNRIKTLADGLRALPVERVEAFFRQFASARGALSAVDFAVRGMIRSLGSLLKFIGGNLSTISTLFLGVGILIGQGLQFVVNQAVSFLEAVLDAAFGALATSARNKAKELESKAFLGATFKSTVLNAVADLFEVEGGIDLPRFDIFKGVSTADLLEQFQQSDIFKKLKELEPAVAESIEESITSLQDAATKALIGEKRFRFENIVGQLTTEAGERALSARLTRISEEFEKFGLVNEPIEQIRSSLDLINEFRLKEEPLEALRKRIIEIATQRAILRDELQEKIELQESLGPPIGQEQVDRILSIRTSILALRSAVDGLGTRLLRLRALSNVFREGSSSVQVFIDVLQNANSATGAIAEGIRGFGRIFAESLVGLSEADPFEFPLTRIFEFIKEAESGGIAFEDIRKGLVEQLKQLREEGRLPFEIDLESIKKAQGSLRVFSEVFSQLAADNPLRKLEGPAKRLSELLRIISGELSRTAQNANAAQEALTPTAGVNQFLVVVQDAGRAIDQINRSLSASFVNVGDQIRRAGTFVGPEVNQNIRFSAEGIRQSGLPTKLDEQTALLKSIDEKLATLNASQAAAGAGGAAGVGGANVRTTVTNYNSAGNPDRSRSQLEMETGVTVPEEALLGR